MSGMSDRIEAFIMELLKSEQPDEWLNLQRNELAAVFGCVPSQINYVISTRFNKERGYIVESRRGGGGYLRIKRISVNADELIQRLMLAAGDSLSREDARAYTERMFQSELINSRTAALMLAALSDNSLQLRQPERDRLRANIFKNMIATIEVNSLQSKL